MPRRDAPTSPLRIVAGAVLVGALLVLAVDQRRRLAPSDCVRLESWDRARGLGGSPAQALGRYPRRDRDPEEVRAYLRRCAFWQEGPGAAGADLLHVRR